MSFSRSFILTFLLMFTFSTLAKNTGKPKEGLVAIGLGAGPHTIKDPEKSMDTDAHGTFFGSVNFKILGPMHVALGMEGNAETGKVNYRYLGPDAVNYSINDLKYSMGGQRGWAGIRMHLLDFEYFHLFAEYGAFFGYSKIRYSTYQTGISAQGSQYQEEQDKIWHAGDYADAGFDIMGSKWGFRFGERVTRGHTSTIHALGEKRLKYIEAVSYAAVVFRP